MLATCQAGTGGKIGRRDGGAGDSVKPLLPGQGYGAVVETPKAVIETTWTGTQGLIPSVRRGGGGGSGSGRRRLVPAATRASKATAASGHGHAACIP
jgi:hypothetical protein